MSSSVFEGYDKLKAVLDAKRVSLFVAGIKYSGRFSPTYTVGNKILHFFKLACQVCVLLFHFSFVWKLARCLSASPYRPVVLQITLH